MRERDPECGCRCIDWFAGRGCAQSRRHRARFGSRLARGEGVQILLGGALKKGPAVVYFYPSAYTQGCDLEAHTFATEKDKFDTAGATIIGVSADSIERLNQFSADPDYCAGKFPVASDADGAIAKSYNLNQAPHGRGPKM